MALSSFTKTEQSKIHKIKQFFFPNKHFQFCCYHCMEASTIVVGSNKHVIGAVGSVPERVLRRDELNGGGNESASVANGGEPIHGAEVTGHINGDEEEVSFIRVKCPYDVVV